MTRSAGRRIAGWCLVWLLLCTPLFADTVSGYVLHGVTDEPVTGVDVAFLIAGEDGGMSPMATTSVDDEGRFQFSGPFLRAGSRFALSVEYEGVTYPSSALEVGAQDEIILEVYDTRDDPSRIRINSHNIFLGIVGQTLEAAHLVQAENTADFTHAAASSDGHVTGLEFVVPAELVMLQGHTGELHRHTATRIVDLNPVPPGATQVAFTFQVEPDAFDGRYVHEAVYPTDHLDLFVQPVSTQLGAPFDDLGAVELHGQTYRHYRAHDLLAGQRLTIELPFSKPVRWALKWALLALVPIVLIGVLTVARRPTTGEAPAPTTAATPGSSREQLLAEIAATRHQLATADDATRQTLQTHHDRLMAQARELYRQPPAA